MLPGAFRGGAAERGFRGKMSEQVRERRRQRGELYSGTEVMEQVPVLKQTFTFETAGTFCKAEQEQLSRMWPL